MPLCMLMNLFMYVTYGIMCNCFGFQACRLPTKHMVAYPPSIFPLYQGMKVATIDLPKVTCCYDMLSLSEIMKIKHVTFSLSHKVL